MIAPYLPAATVVVASVFSTLAMLIFLVVMPRGRREVSLVSAPSIPADQTVFLFEDRELVDLTHSARSLIESLPANGSEWDRLLAYLVSNFVGLECRVSQTLTSDVVELKGGAEDTLRLRLQRIGGMLRVSIADISVEGQVVWVDGLSLGAQEKELATLRETLAAAPLLIWRVNAIGAVSWANKAYLDRVAELNENGDTALTWPLPNLFADIPVEVHPGDCARARLQYRQGSTCQWYEWHCQASPAGTLFYAFRADATVNAEKSLQEFIQTLTKTFANLPIGLAIFDRQRQLAIFNPALTDLTSLDIVFLSSKPSLFDFLDRLRENRIIPEPKDYPGWREQMAALEIAAASGQFEEIWSLDTGRTYKITGQPHPDGALAFQIEDISAETTLSRHFHSEIELGQEVIDTFGGALSVFSPTGELILSNSAYRTLWGSDPGSTLGTVNVADSIRQWQSRTKPTPVWGDLREFVISAEERVGWCAEIHLKDSSALSCRVVPLSGGRTLVSFNHLGSSGKDIPPLPSRTDAVEPAEV
ncbi:MAG: PAS-domain containing protein [Albidovulum sp.]